MSDSFQVHLPIQHGPISARLWPYFSKTFTSIMGYAPEDFRFEPGKTPMGSTKETVATLITYYVIILGGRELMRNRPAFELNGLFKIHNFYLTIISGALLALFVEQLAPIILNNGLFYSICNRGGGWKDELVVLYYLNYLTKYLELLDTVFLVLKKKPLTFLHTYHHGATALLCYTQLRGRTAVSWVPITLNLMVHVVMYWYYFQAARGIKIWWKQYITVLQITQFVLDLGFVYFAFYTQLAASYWKGLGLPTFGFCHGEEWAAYAGAFILSSYLWLFMLFYAATYKKPNQKKGTKRATDALVDVKQAQVADPTEVYRKIAGEMSAVNGHAPRKEEPMCNGNGNVDTTRPRVG